MISSQKIRLALTALNRPMRRVTRILIYHAIRSRSPVYYDARLERWLVTGYREVQLVLGDLRFSSKGAARLSAPDQQGNYSALAQNLARNMIRNDPPKAKR